MLISHIRRVGTIGTKRLAQSLQMSTKITNISKSLIPNPGENEMVTKKNISRLWPFNVFLTKNLFKTNDRLSARKLSIYAGMCIDSPLKKFGSWF